MNPDDIQQRALETWHTEQYPLDLQFEHASMALACEAGEYLALHMKHLFKPLHESTRERRLDELGDVLYHVAVLAKLDGVTLDELSQMNHHKLTKNGDNHGWQPNYYKYDREALVE